MNRKRTFSCDKNRVQSFQDHVFAELLEKVVDLEQGARPMVDDVLLADLDRDRTGEMQDIVRTIQAAQYELKEAELDQILVVQGGPGTGKTVVALHRVSWLLFNHPAELSPADVLVVGPSKTFVRYIQQVLPSLGDEKVVQRDITQLAPRVSLGRQETGVAQLVKGDLKMARVLDRGLADRILVPQADLDVRAAGRTLVIPREPLLARIDELRPLPYNVGRGQLRDWVRGRLQTEYDQVPGAEVLDQAVNRVWPQLSAPAFLQELLGSQDRLLRAAGEDLTGREVGLLHRPAAPRLGDEQWSVADLPLLDHVDAAMNGAAPESFRHVVVDEAQDLSPMQLASLGRRMTHGSVTLLGDMAQSTSAWARDSWDELLEQLMHFTPDSPRPAVHELQYGYRVPTQVFDNAARLLPVVAPSVNAPTVVRPGPAAPELLHEDVDDIAGRTAEQARTYAGHGYMVGIICPDARRADVEAALRSRTMRWGDSARDGLAAGINVMSPDTAKGLEFDAAIVAYPDEIVGDDVRVGGRLLYIAMTRCTQELAVVYAEDPFGGVLAEAPSDGHAEAVSDDGGLWPAAHLQPPLLTVLPTPRRDEEKPARVLKPTAPAASGSSRIVRGIARQVADDVLATLQPGQLPQFLEELASLLKDASGADDVRDVSKAASVVEDPGVTRTP